MLLFLIVRGRLGVRMHWQDARDERHRLPCIQVLPDSRTKLPLWRTAEKLDGVPLHTVHIQQMVIGSMLSKSMCQGVA